MFKCQACRKISLPREPQTTRVVETRPVTYSNIVKTVVKSETGPEVVETRETTGHGWEIVRELKVCSSCAQRIAS